MLYTSLTLVFRTQNGHTQWVPLTLFIFKLRDEGPERLYNLPKLHSQHPQMPACHPTLCSLACLPLVLCTSFRGKLTMSSLQKILYGSSFSGKRGRDIRVLSRLGSRAGASVQEDFTLRQQGTVWGDSYSAELPAL